MAEQQQQVEYKSLSALLAAPKGNLAYTPGEAFLLQVFWQTPSLAAARELLSGLRRCGVATHRDTPCVPTYFFRIAKNDTEICPLPARTVGEHPHLREAKRKLQLGVPAPAVRAHLTKLGLDPNLVDLEDDAALPAELQSQQPVAVECTELYMDERAMMEHAGSRDYLDGYGVVMNPALQHGRPCTVRLGTPNASMIEKILEPILQERVAPLADGCAVWRPPPPSSSEGHALFLSLDLTMVNGADVSSLLPSAFVEHCTTFVTFAHPLRADTTRLLCVLPWLQLRQNTDVLASLAALPLARGEAHMTSGSSEEEVEAARAALEAAGLGRVTVNATESAGYVLHSKAADIHPYEGTVKLN